MSSRGIIIAIILMVIVVLGLSFAGRICENVPADKICVIQDPVDGELHFYTTQGLKYQNFGTPTNYSKRFQYWFTANADQGSPTNQSIKIRFNDGGHANISGSCSIELPTDVASLTELHTKYGSEEAIVNELVRTAMEKAIYMTGPLMSSKESYAEKRNELIHDIEDQATGGIYSTISRDIKGTDPMTGADKTITVVEPVIDEKTKLIIRAEESPLQRFHIKIYNLSINEIKYDNNVEKQIEEQQKAMMAVQTAIAEAKKAEQDAIKAEQEGKAEAAKAKWEREKSKAAAVVAAQERFEVAQLDKQTAEQRKQENILTGEGEAAKKRLIMEADGALQQKLATYERVMTKFAEEFGKQKWVPDVQLGGSSGDEAGGSVTQLMNLLTAQTAKSLALDMRIPSGK